MSAVRDATAGPFTLNEVLTEELQALRPGRFDELRGTPFVDPTEPRANEAGRSSNLREIYLGIAGLGGEDRLSALCLSGGGIRSATFNLGVLQALARAGVLGRFDYLSTVSGGGYIGAWLRAWMTRAGRDAVLGELTATPEMPLKPEPRPVDRLREYSNYLTPRRGMMSGDTWAAIAIVLRNILLNWLVMVPLLMTVVAVPLIVAAVVDGGMAARLTFGTVVAVIAAAVALALAGSAVVERERAIPTPNDSAATERILVRGLLPVVMATAVFAIGSAWLIAGLGLSGAIMPLAAIWYIAVPIAGWAIGTRGARDRAELRRPYAEIFALAVSGAAVAGLLIAVARAVPGFHGTTPLHAAAYTLLAAPVLLGLQLAGRTLYVALVDRAAPRGQGTRAGAGASAGAFEDADREWWARYSGYIMLSALAWLGIGALALFGWGVMERLFQQYAVPALAGTGGIAATVAAIVGMRGGSGSGHDAGGGAKEQTRQTWALRVAGPVLCLATVPLFALCYMLLAAALGAVPVGGTGAASLHNAALFAVPAALLLLVSGLAGVIVNVNRFSLHGFYRNRLVRAYLGASNPGRRPDPFTGFDPADNLKLSTLWPAGGTAERLRPLHVINTTLNLVRGDRLAWQERKAESFSMSPFFCGNFYEGYRRTAEYHGRGGITLGTAIAISGAAANPNMGYHSSAAVTFLLTLLNGRLGAWLGNTNRHGDATYRRSAPAWAVTPMLNELLGRTRADSSYVQLSDGGHFDNLGIYEMVLRRCRLIVASDAGRDPTSGFEDLGNLIRKVRIDFGIRIDFDDPIRIMPRTAAGPGLACAVGVIRYSDVDGDVPDGTLIYIKPTLSADGVVPYDIFSYSRAAAEFPHETTVDQWFTESQFESYRMLGSHLVSRMTGGRTDMTLGAFETAARAYAGAAQRDAQSATVEV